MNLKPLLQSVLRVTSAVIGIILLALLSQFAGGRCWCGSGKGTMSRGDADRLKPLQQRLETHVRVLAGEIGERNVFRPAAYQKSAEYITGVFRECGYEVERELFKAEGKECANLIATRPGKSLAKQIIVVGAHYDSVAGCPGANDNGSAVASMLELARVFAKEEPSRTVRFVALANEEPPFFKTEEMGSRVHARQARQRGDDIRVMIALETIGYYSDEKGSQKYPPPFNLLYPDRGSFIAFVGNFSSRSVLCRAVQAFKLNSDVPAESCATFASVPGVDWSDHGSFWIEGYRGFMVTDTAPFRYKHYHELTDTPEKLNYEMMGRVTLGMEAVLRDLALGKDF